MKSFHSFSLSLLFIFWPQGRLACSPPGMPKPGSRPPYWRPPPPLAMLWRYAFCMSDRRPPVSKDWILAQKRVSELCWTYEGLVHAEPCELTGILGDFCKAGLAIKAVCSLKSCPGLEGSTHDCHWMVGSKAGSEVRQVSAPWRVCGSTCALPRVLAGAKASDVQLGKLLRQICIAGSRQIAKRVAYNVLNDQSHGKGGLRSLL